MISIIRSIASPTSMLYWLNLAVVALLICAVSLLCVKLIRNRSEVFRHAFVVTSLLVLLVSPIAVWVGTHSQLGLLTIKNNLPAQTPAPLSPDTPAQARSPWEEFALKFIFSDQDAVEGESAKNEQNEAPAAASAPPRVAVNIPWKQLGFSLLLMIWCCGTVWFVLQTIRGGVRIRKYLRLSIPVTEKVILAARQCAAQKVGLATIPPILKSEWVPVPLSTGVCYSAVILPEAFLREASQEEIEAVLTHELAHISRRDHWVGLVQQLTVAIFWWNPLVYPLSRLCSCLAEEICDDYAANSLKDGEDFARLLVGMAERVVKHVHIPLAIEILPARRHDLERRITRLMQKERKMKTRLSLNHVALVSLFGLLMMATSVLSTVWADSRADIPADSPDTEAAATSPEERTGALDETSIEESVEKDGETPSSAQGETFPGQSVAPSQGKLRLLMEGNRFDHFDSRLSPDGLKLAYSTGRPGMIVVRDLSTDVERKYEKTTLDAAFPVWSPDGKRIAFMDTQDGNVPVSILTLESGEVEVTDIQLAFPYDWSGNGRFLLVEDISVDEKGSYLVDLKAGKTQGATRYYAFFSGIDTGFPRLSPDGHYVAFSSSEDAEESDIFVHSMGSDERIRITSHRGADRSPLWSVDGKYILFVSSREQGLHHLNSIAFEGGKPLGEPEIVVSDMGDSVTLNSCSNSGSLLFSERSDNQLGVYSTDIDPVSGAVLGEPDQLTDGRSKASGPAWSLNGKYIAYYEITESGDFLLCVMNSDGSDKRTLGSISVYDRGNIRKAWRPKAWHPDNDQILYSGREADPENPEKTLDGIYSISIRSRERKLIYHDPDFQGGMHVSPDGKHLALTSGSDQKPQLYIVDYDGQNRRQLVKSDGAIRKPCFTPDGKEIIYTFAVSAEGKEDRRSIMAVSIAGGEPREIYAREDPNDGFDTHPASWLPDGRFVFDIIHAQDDRPQYAINMDGKSAPVKISDSGRLRGGYSVSPDGTKAVFGLWTTSTSKLWLMSDFLPED